MVRKKKKKKTKKEKKGGCGGSEGDEGKEEEGKKKTIKEKNRREKFYVPLSRNETRRACRMRNGHGLYCQCVWYDN